jgi:large subunit ribosomal protein L1
MQKQTLPANYNSKKEYALADVPALVKELSTSKFVGTVNLDVVMKISKKQQGESLKGNVSLPHRFGEAKRVIVFADEKRAGEAIAAGAVDAGLAELMKKVETNAIAYDVVLATPDVMSQIAKLGKILGPKGLMPNPGNGTIGTDVTALVQSYMAGKMNFKMSDQGVVRAGVAKLDMDNTQILENIKAFLKAVMQEGKKFGGQPFGKITISPTMGKGVKVDLNDLYTQLA